MTKCDNYFLETAAGLQQQENTEISLWRTDNV
jgi:hypothetical protein